MKYRISLEEGNFATVEADSPQAAADKVTLIITEITKPITYAVRNANKVCRVL